MNTKNLSVNTKKSLPQNSSNSNQELFTTKDVASVLTVSERTVRRAATKLGCGQRLSEGSNNWGFTKEDVTLMLDYMQHNNNRTDLPSTKVVQITSTDLTPALMIKQAMELAQKGYELELKRIEAEKNRIAQERDILQIELDESKDWFSIKRMQKLNPDITFKYSVLKKESARLGYEIKKVFDANYGEVNAYHKSVYESLFFDTLDFGE